MTSSSVRPLSGVTWQPELTAHELAALRLLAAGHTHTDIAGLLKVRPETAGQLLNMVRLRLRARTLPHAVAVAYEVGLLGQRGAVAGAAGAAQAP